MSEQSSQPTCRDCPWPISPEQHRYGGRCARCHGEWNREMFADFRRMEREACSYLDESAEEETD